MVTQEQSFSSVVSDIKSELSAPSITTKFQQLQSVAPNAEYQKLAQGLESLVSGIANAFDVGEVENMDASRSLRDIHKQLTETLGRYW